MIDEMQKNQKSAKKLIETIENIRDQGEIKGYFDIILSKAKLMKSKDFEYNEKFSETEFRKSLAEMKTSVMKLSTRKYEELYEKILSALKLEAESEEKLKKDCDTVVAKYKLMDYFDGKKTGLNAKEYKDLLNKVENSKEDIKILTALKGSGFDIMKAEGPYDNNKRESLKSILEKKKEELKLKEELENINQLISFFEAKDNEHYIEPKEYKKLVSDIFKNKNIESKKDFILYSQEWTKEECKKELKKVKIGIEYLYKKQFVVGGLQNQKVQKDEKVSYKEYLQLLKPKREEKVSIEDKVDLLLEKHYHEKLEEYHKELKERVRKENSLSAVKARFLSICDILIERLNQGENKVLKDLRNYLAHDDWFIDLLVDKKKLKDNFNNLIDSVDKISSEREKFTKEVANILVQHSPLEKSYSVNLGDESSFRYSPSSSSKDGGKNFVTKKSICSTARTRKKRSVESCIRWEEIDKFNEEKRASRDPDKIKVNSEEFIKYTRSLLNDKNFNEEKLSNAVELARATQVTGKYEYKVDMLVNNKKVVDHLGNVERFSNSIMHGVMLNSIAHDLLSGNYKDVAVNLRDISVNYAFSKAGQSLFIKGGKFVSTGSKFVGYSLKASSPFVSRIGSVFNVVDLLNAVEKYKAGNEEALVGVISNGIILGVDLAEIGIGVAEAFQIASGVSYITGPIGGIIMVGLVVGTEIYSALRGVNKIDEMIHLTTEEKFIETLRAIIGLKPRWTVQESLRKKEIYNQLIQQELEFLKDNTNITRYAFPSAGSRTHLYDLITHNDSCTSCYPKGEGFFGVICEGAKSGGYSYVAKEECIQEGNSSFRLTTSQEPNGKVEFDFYPDNKMEFNKIRDDLTWFKVRPDKPDMGDLLCLPATNEYILPSGDSTEPAPRGSYFCESAFGIQYTENRTDNYTLINLGDGEDRAKGFKDSSNIFLIGNGKKLITGGNRDDVFIFRGNCTTPREGVKTYGAEQKYIVDGHGGINVINLSQFSPNAKFLSIDLSKQFMKVESESPCQSLDIELSGITHVVGRESKEDTISYACNTKEVSGNGGEAIDRADSIVIPRHDSCFYDTKVVIKPYTVVNNYAVNGNFSYFITNEGQGRAYVNLESNSKGNNIFIFNHTLQDIIDVYRYNTTSVIFSFVETSYKDHKWLGDGFNVIINGLPERNVTYQLIDNTELKVGKEGMYAVQTTNKSIDDIIMDYPSVAKKLGIPIFVQSPKNNSTVAIGGSHNVLHNNPYSQSHLVGSGNENVFIIASRYEKLNFERLPIPEVLLYNLNEEGATYTLDLRKTKEQVKKDLGREIDIEIDVADDDLLVQLFCSGRSKESIVKVRLKDALENNWYEELQVITDNVPMRINRVENSFQLTPSYLVFDEAERTTFIIGSKDVEKENRIEFNKKIGDYIFARDNNSLIITNAFNDIVGKDEVCTLVLDGFYQEIEKMKTLGIGFNDKRILLRDEAKSINDAKDFNELKRQFKIVDKYKEVLCDNWSLSHIADNDKRDMIEYLIGKGADVNAKDNEGDTPLHHVARIGGLRAVKYLIEERADVNATNNYGQTPLHYASSSNWLCIVEYLVKKDADINAQDKNGSKPSNFAIYYGHIDTLEFLIKAGADVSVQDLAGYRIDMNRVIEQLSIKLIDAVKNNSFDEVQKRISQGADINFKDENGKTPLDIARDKGYSNIVKYLEEKLNQERGEPAQRRRRHYHGDHNRHHLPHRPPAIDLNNQPEIAARQDVSKNSLQSDDTGYNKGKATSGGSKPFSWINDLCGWVKGSIGGLFYSKAALSEEASNTASPIPQVDAQIDVNGTIMLLDVLVRKVTGQKYISTVDQPISPLEAQGYALNITKGFEKVVEQAAKDSKISMHRLNINFVGMHKEITGKVMSGKFNEISGVLKSYIEKACPGREVGYPGKLSSKKFDKFMLEFNSRLNIVLNQSIQQILHNVDGTLEADGAKQMSLEPQSYLSNASIQSHSKDKVSTCLSDIGVTKLGNTLSK